MAETPTPAGRRSVPWKWILWGVLGALVFGLVLYFTGVQQGRSGVVERDARLDSLRREQTQLSRQLTRAEDRGRMRHALALLYRTTLDLDARNFGTANERLEEAAAVLSEVEDAGEALSALRREVAETDLEVAADLQAQRARVVDVAARLDALVAAGDASPAAPADTLTP